MTPPAWFVNSLHGLDPLLTVYWGNAVNKWVIARKSVLGVEELTRLKNRVVRLQDRIIPNFSGHPFKLKKLKTTLAGLMEDVAAGVVGKRVILIANSLNQEVYDALVVADMSRYGGYARFADMLEKEEEVKERAIEKKLAEQRLNFNKEVYDMMGHVWRKKEAKLLQGERDMKYLLTGGQRSKPGDAPLIQITDF